MPASAVSVVAVEERAGALIDIDIAWIWTRAADISEVRLLARDANSCAIATSTRVHVTTADNTSSSSSTCVHSSILCAHMSSNSKGKPQYRAPCLCGCKSKSPATIASHGKRIARRAKKDDLAHARSASNLIGPSARRLAPPSHLLPRKPRQPAQLVSNDTTEDPMDVDHPQAGASHDPPPPISHVWVDRPSRREREDEDLVPEPGSPESSENEDGPEGDENQDPDEPDFLSDEEPPLVHVEIPAREQLNADFQLYAAKAGMLLNTDFLILHRSHFALSTGTFGPRGPRYNLCFQLSHHQIDDKRRIRGSATRLPHSSPKCTITVPNAMPDR